MTEKITAADRERLLTAAAAREFFGGVSDMTFWRWSKNPALAFPPPIIINKRRFWTLGALIDHRDKLAARSADRDGDAPAA